MAGYIANDDYYQDYYNSSGESGMIGGLFNFGRNLIQGACSGGMTFAGILTAIGADLTLLPNLPLEAFVLSTLEMLEIGDFAVSTYAGPVMIAIGAGLFLTARRGIARTLGIIGIIGYITAHATGLDLSPYLTQLEPMIDQATVLWSQLAPFIEGLGQ